MPAKHVSPHVRLRTRLHKRLRARRVAALAIVVAVSALTSRASAELEGGVFTSAEWRIEIESPTNWQPTEQTAYPDILLWMDRREPRGVMLLAAERLEAALESVSYAKQTIPKLEKMGFRARPPQLHTTTGATIVDFENDTSFLRQAFLVIEGVGFTLTMSAETNRARGLHFRAFDAALRSLRPLRDQPGNDGSVKDGGP